MEIQRCFLYYEAFLCGGRVWKEGGVHLDSNVRGHARTYVRTLVRTYERTCMQLSNTYVRILTCVTICGARPSVPKKRKNKRPGGPGPRDRPGPGVVPLLARSLL